MSQQRFHSLARIGLATAVVTVGVLIPARYATQKHVVSERCSSVVESPLADNELSAVGLIESIDSLDLGPNALGELTNSAATDINDKSQIVGYAFDNEGETVRAFLVSGRKGALLPLPDGAKLSIASGVNNKGVVIGVTDRNEISSARWAGGKAETLTYGDETTMPFAVNGAGDTFGAVVKRCSHVGVPSNLIHPSWGGFPTDISHLPAFLQSENCDLSDILDDATGGSLLWPAGKTEPRIFPGLLVFSANEKGAVVGVGIQKDRPVPIMIAGDKKSILPLPSGFGAGVARGINGRNQAIGYGFSDDGETFAPLFWAGGGKSVKLPGINGGLAMGQDVADNGDIVGVAVVEKKGHAVLWRGGKIVDLNRALPPDSGWTLLVATGINNRGEIVGFGEKDGTIQAFVVKLQQ